MKFIEVNYGASKAAINIDKIIMIEPLSKGSQINLRVGGPNTLIIKVNDSYDEILNMIARKNS